MLVICPGEVIFTQITIYLFWCKVKIVSVEITLLLKIHTIIYSIQLDCVKACNFIKKESLAQVFSCEFCEISKNIFFYRTPLVAASEQKVMNLINKNNKKKK